MLARVSEASCCEDCAESCAAIAEIRWGVRALADTSWGSESKSSISKNEATLESRRASLEGGARELRARRTTICVPAARMEGVQTQQKCAQDKQVADLICSPVNVIICEEDARGDEQGVVVRQQL